MATIKTKRTAKRRAARSGIPAERLAEMIEEATVDAYGESEQATGWFTMFEDYVELPFETEVLGVSVTVESIALRDDDRIVALCKRGKERQAIDIKELPLPKKRPAGAEWIEAYREWSSGR
jgi:hypothetical protein